MTTSRTSCRHLDIKPDRRGRFIQRKNAAHRCLVPQPELPLLPACITGHHSFSAQFGRSSVGKDECAKCPLHEARDD